MARIPLTIDPTYCKDWGFWEGCREMIQNAKDADEFDDAKMTVEHMPRSNKLIITNAGVSVPTATLLLLGKSSKGETRQRGQFGEGFVLGCLALVRAGHAVTIYNGEEVWRPEISVDETGPFAGESVLSFSTRKLQTAREDFSVEIEGVTKDIWAATKRLFLFLQAGDAEDAVRVQGNAVLLSDTHKGMIFSRGIYVTKMDDLEYGYDLAYLKLDRDRRTVDEWDLKWKLSSLWVDAQRAHPEKFTDHVYRMAKENKEEVKQIEYHADQKLLEALRASYTLEHGDAIPVATMQESEELSKLGAKTVTVPKTLKTLLEKTGSPLEEVKKKLRDAVFRRFTWEDLTDTEHTVCREWVQRVTDAYVVVEFADPEVQARTITGEGLVAVSKDALTLPPRELVLVVARAEAARRGGTVEDVLLSVIFGKKE